MKCIKHNDDLRNKVSGPPRECEICIDNAFNPKLCKICREKEGCEIADGLKICESCEKLYFK